MEYSITNPQTTRNTSVSSPFKKALKDYKDELLTGLTDDERKEINAKVDKYIKERTKNGPVDPKVLAKDVAQYTKNLLKEYGFKGGDDFSDVIGSQTEGNTCCANGVDADASGSSTASLSVQDVSSSSVSEVVTEPNGKKYIVITSPNGMKIKIELGADGMDDESGDVLQSLKSSNDKDKSANAAKTYERNIDSYFDKANAD